MLENYRNDERIWSITGHNQQNNIQRGRGLITLVSIQEVGVGQLGKDLGRSMIEI